jgi:hypothetical protein
MFERENSEAVYRHSLQYALTATKIWCDSWPYLYYLHDWAVVVPEHEPECRA